MKSYNNLWPHICNWDNLLLAHRKARKGKRYRSQVLAFEFRLEENLFDLLTALEDQSYRPGTPNQFVLWEGKRRVITAAPYPDRVVHHALCNVIEPLFERSFIFDSYACRKGKGTHAAADRCTHYMCRGGYYLQCDISQYFPSIDREILLRMLDRKIRCAKTRWLTRLIVASAAAPEKRIQYFAGDDLFTPQTRATGLPIGNQTSQFFANVYLDGFDHFVREDLHPHGYVRYVDDFLLFDDDKKRLHATLAACQEYLAGLRLTLHPRRCRVARCDKGVTFVGYRIFPTHRRIKNSNARRFGRRLLRLAENYAEGQVELNDVAASVRSWIGHATHANTVAMRKELFRSVTFARHAAR